MPLGGGPSPLKAKRRLTTSIVPVLLSSLVYTLYRLYAGMYTCTVYCTVATVQSVQCVHKFTSQQVMRRGLLSTLKHSMLWFNLLHQYIVPLYMIPLSVMPLYVMPLSVMPLYIASLYMMPVYVILPYVLPFYRI